MSERWSWIVRYVIVVIVAVALGAALGETELFKSTRLGKTGLNAARLAQFLGYGGALLVFWLLAQRAAKLLPVQDKRWGAVCSAVIPLATLIVIACGQAVALLVLGPLMSKTWHEIYNWVFIAAIILSAGWLVWTLFTGSPSLAALFGTTAKPGQDR